MTCLKRLFKNIALIGIGLTLVFSVGFLSACSKDTNKLVLAGSTSVQPYAELLAEEFERLSDGLKLDVQGGGSSAGISAARSGIAAIGMSSRSLKDNENDLLAIEIAKDGLAIIVNPNNPLLASKNAELNLPAEQIRKIYTKEIKKWSDLGLPLYGKDKEIHVITREDGSGTRTAFEESIMSGSRITNKATVQNSNGAIRHLVSDDIHAVGFISLGLVEAKKGEKEVKSVAVDGIDATIENVLNGSYKLTRPFLFVLKEEPEGLAKDFIDFTLSEEGKKILKNEGLIT